MVLFITRSSRVWTPCVKLPDRGGNQLRHGRYKDKDSPVSTSKLPLPSPCNSPLHPFRSSSLRALCCSLQPVVLSAWENLVRLFHQCVAIPQRCSSTVDTDPEDGGDKLLWLNNLTPAKRGKGKIILQCVTIPQRICLSTVGIDSEDDGDKLLWLQESSKPVKRVTIAEGRIMVQRYPAVPQCLAYQ